MNLIHCFGNKFQYLCSCSCIKVACLSKSVASSMESLYGYLVFHLNPFWVQFCYFMSVSTLGFLVLRHIEPRSSSDYPASYRPNDLNVFFTSMSATTVSSMSTVEMEVFSNTQLVILTIIMLLGSEVFVYMLEIQLEKSKLLIKKQKQENVIVDYDDEIELGGLRSNGLSSFESTIVRVNQQSSRSTELELKYKTFKYLGYVVLVYLLVVLILGSTLVSIYMNLAPNANKVLKDKGLNIQTFSVFTIVSTFANCGFIPTNENMVIFRNNSGLLLLLIPQVLFGNTLFPACLKVILWFLGRFSKRDELKYMSKTDNNLGYPANDMLISNKQSLNLVGTVMGFILVQFILFCTLEWNSEGLDRMNPYQKIVAALFQTVNTRHSGENIIDLSTLSPAILVIFVIMMFFPPYMSFFPLKNDEQSLEEDRQGKKDRVVDNLLFSQLSYLAIFIILICLVERKNIEDDPLNFNVLNITIEVIAAYGNVGYTMGYSCKKQLKPDGHCKDMAFGFVGRWSNTGKVILIIVMLFGRLKKFNLNGGKAWKMSSTKDQ